MPSLEAQRSSIELALFKPLNFKFLKDACWPLFACLKGIALAFQLSLALMSSSRADAIIVQNPPALPVLPVVVLVGYLRGSRVIIDWHNLGWTMIVLALGSHAEGLAGRAIIRICWFLEVWSSRCATSHLCVTNAMQAYLSENLGLAATTLHDRPPAFFNSASSTRQRHDIFVRLREV